MIDCPPSTRKIPDDLLTIHPFEHTAMRCEPTTYQQNRLQIRLLPVTICHFGDHMSLP